MDTWPFDKSPPLAAFRDLLADPLPPPDWQRGFWMSPSLEVLFIKFYIWGTNIA